MKWEKKELFMEQKLNLPRTAGGWDSEMAAYPCVITSRENTYIFYNGNNFGYEGFGYAELVED